MQFIENSIAGVRAAIMRLRSREARCSYTLLPMIHVGEQAFYDEVMRELESHDLILYESIDHPLGRSLSRDYERIAASPRIKLVTQRAALSGNPKLRGKWVHMDASGDAFAAWWRQLPLWLRLVLPPAKWAIFFRLRWFGDRVALGGRLATNDLRSSQEVLDLDEGPGLGWLITEQRDKAIVANLERFHATVADKPVSIAVLFGAAHMRAITHHLMNHHRFQAFEPRWVTVFGWETP